MFDMSLRSALDVFCYVLVLVYGLALSADIATGGTVTRRQKRMLSLLCLLFLAVQALGLVLLGERMVEYPLDSYLQKMMVMGEKYGCTAEIAVIVAMLSVPNVGVGGACEV